MHAGKVSARRGRSAHICADHDYASVLSLFSFIPLSLSLSLSILGPPSTRSPAAPRFPTIPPAPRHPRGIPEFPSKNSPGNSREIRSTNYRMKEEGKKRERRGKEVSRTNAQAVPAAAAFNFNESLSLMRVPLIKDFHRELIRH